MYLICLRIEETFDWKVLVIASHLLHYRQLWELCLANHRVLLEVPNEVAVHLAVGVEEVYKNRIVGHETTGDEGVREVLDGHAPVVNAKPLVDAELVSLLVHSEGIDVELAIVHIPE